MQGHVGISMMWRDSEAREKGHCFAKQPPNKLKFMTIYDESNTITWVMIVMQLTMFLLLYTQIKERELLGDN